MSALVLLLCAVSAPPKGSVYHVDPLIDGAATVAMFSVGALIDREKDFWSGLSPCDHLGRIPTEAELKAFEALGEGEGVCARDSIGVFEIFVADRTSPGSRLASDILLAALAAAPYAFSLTDVFVSDVEEPGWRFGESSLIALETQSAALFFTNILKLIVKRPRPLTHNPLRPKLERYEGDARLSFPSGHSAFSFASATLIAYEAQLRHGNSPVTWIAGITAYATAAVVAYLRVASGKHFITDVFGGAVLGVVAGLVLPRLHERSRPPADQTPSPLVISFGAEF